MKYVLVTGASQGLGSSIVKIFASNNYNVIIGYNKNQEKANCLCKEINDNYNVKCYVKRIDITNENDVKETFKECNVDILINNASISMDDYIENKSFNDFMKVVKVNLGGTYLMCKHSKNVKTIVNISSKDGIDTYNPISLDYSASKAGIINLTKNLALYFKDKRVLCIAPGWINTESVLNMNPTYLANELKRVGQKELLDKDYVAKKIYDITMSNIDSGSVVVIDE